MNKIKDFSNYMWLQFCVSLKTCQAGLAYLMTDCPSDQENKQPCVAGKFKPAGIQPWENIHKGRDLCCLRSTYIYF